MLVLVVGPSGAGKDTLMEGARAALAGDGRFVFATREITRPAGAGGEAHVEVSEVEFLSRRAEGHYALSWGAHGLFYGIPAAAIGAGEVVVANVSRSVLAEAAARFAAKVLLITAPLPVLAARLAARGRESAADIAARLAREMVLPEGLEVAEVMNDGSVAEGVAKVVAVLREAAGERA